MISHVSDERSDHQIPKLKDYLLRWLSTSAEASVWDGWSFDNSNTDLNTVRLEEVVEMVEG